MSWGKASTFANLSPICTVILNTTGKVLAHSSNGFRPRPPCVGSLTVVNGRLMLIPQHNTEQDSYIIKEETQQL